MTEGIKCTYVGPNLWVIHPDVPPHRIYVKDGQFHLEPITVTFDPPYEPLKVSWRTPGEEQAEVKIPIVWSKDERCKE